MKKVSTKKRRKPCPSPSGGGCRPQAAGEGEAFAYVSTSKKPPAAIFLSVLRERNMEKKARSPFGSVGPSNRDQIEIALRLRPLPLRWELGKGARVPLRWAVGEGTERRGMAFPATP